MHSAVALQLWTRLEGAKQRWLPLVAVTQRWRRSVEAPLRLIHLAGVLLQWMFLVEALPQ